MATLYFKVSSDWEQVVKLRQECEKLEAQLKKMDSRSAPAATKTLETQLASTKQQMMGLVTEAAKAGAEIENGFKKKIYDASQTVNGLSEKIIAQRAVIKDIEFDVKRLGDAYRTALKNNPIGASGKLAEYNAARKALDEEKAALFGLTQQQAEARLSVKKLRDEYSLYKQEAGETIKTNNGLSLSWGKMLGIIGGATALKSLASQIVRVRGEFQSMQTAIETMVGKDVASGVMTQLKEMAKISPLTLTDMVNAEKMMLGFNIQAEDTVRYLQALSDISMGDSVKFKSLTLAFSQMSAAGKLMGQDLNQMINAGFNPLQIIAEKTGKSIATLKDEMSKGAVSAEMVQQAFIDATSAGGKFYQMSENASKTINGQLSMMQDALDNAFNEMGQASEGVIMEGIQLTTTLIQNYETVGKVLVGLVATYGAYRTAVMLATIATSKHTIAEVALTNARVIARKAQLLLNAAMLTNPYVAVATVVTALAASIWVLSTRTSEAEKATERFNTIMDEHNKKEEEHKQAVDALISTIQDQNKAEGERLAAFEKLKAEYPAIFQNYTTETDFLKEIVKYKRQIAEEDARRSTSSLEEQLRVEQNRLNHYRQVRTSGTSTSLVDMDGNGWASDNVEDAIKAQTQIVNRLKAQISTPLVNSYLESIKTLKDEDIKSVLDEITLSMKALGDSGKDTIAIVASLGGEFSKEQLGMIKSALETEQKSRSERTTYAEDYEQARKDWEEAKKELQKIEADKDKFTSKQYEDAKKRVESTEKAYKKLGGDTKGKGVKSENQILTQQSRIDELEQRQAQDRIRQQVDLENQVAQARIDAMADGAEKASAQRELDNKKELEAIERQKEEYKQKVIQSQKEIFDAQEELKTKQNPNYKKRSFDSSSVSVDTSMFDIIYDFTQKKQVNDRIREQEEAMNRYLQEYGTFQQKRLAITEEYNQKIQKALSENNMGEALAFTQERNRLLSSLDKEKAFEGIEKAFGNISNLSGKAIDSLIDNLKKYKKEAIDTFDVSDIDRYEKALSRLEDAKLENKSSVFSNFIPDFYREQIKLEEEFNQAQETSIELGQKQAELEKEILEYIEKQTGKKFKKEDLYSTEGINGIAGLLSGKGGDSLSKFTEMKSSLDSVSAASDNAGQKMSALFNMKGGSGGGASTVAVIDTIVHGINDLVQGLNDMANEIKDTMEALGRNTDIDSGIGKFAEGMSMFAEASQGATDAWDSLKSGNIGGVFAGVTKSFTAWIKGFAGIHDKKNEKRIQQLQEQVDTLTDSYDKLGRAVEDAYSKDASGLIEDQNKLLEQQKLLIEQQIREEQDKKNTDDERIKEWQRQIEEINQTIEDNKEAAVDAIFGEDLQSAIENFADAYAEAWANGEDKAESAKDTVKKMMQQMVTESIKAAMQSSGAMEEIRNKLQQFYADNVLTGWEQDYIYNMAEELQKELDSQFGWADSLFGNDEAKKQQSASSRGFGTEMTHEDAGELSGRFTALNESSLRQESIQQGISDIADDMRNIIAQSYLELQQISENTGEIIKPIKQMQLDIAEVKRNTSRI